MIRHLVARDEHNITCASCVDCDWLAAGKNARKRAGQHAIRRNHRVAFSRTYVAELRPKTWPT